MTSHIENKKQEIITEFMEVRKNILNLAGSLPPYKQSNKFLGVWTINDLLAHLEGWDWANINAVDSVLNQELPEFYLHYDKDWRSYNKELVNRCHINELPELIQQVRKSHQILARRLQALPVNDWFRDSGLRFKGFRITIAKLIQAEISDENVHAKQLSAFIKS